MDPGHKARKNPFDNADLGFQAVGPALCIMQLNVEGLSAAKRHIIESLAETHHIDVICLQETHVNDETMCSLSNGAIFSDWMNHNPDLKGRNDAIERDNYNGMLVGTYTHFNCVISNNLD